MNNSNVSIQHNGWFRVRFRSIHTSDDFQKYYIWIAVQGVLISSSSMATYTYVLLGCYDLTNAHKTTTEEITEFFDEIT